MITCFTNFAVTIDWFSYTANSPAYHPEMTMNCIELDRGLYGYTVGVRFLDDRIELVNPDRPEMRIHVQYSGSSLLKLSTDYQVSPFDVISLKPCQEKVTRIDIALDIRDGSLDIASLAKLTDIGHYVSSATVAMYVETLGAAGETLYVGAPSSDQRLRIYDKAAEQGLDCEWTRIELQVRGERAHTLKNGLALSDNPQDMIPQQIRAFCDFPGSREYQIAVGSKSSPLGAPQRSETDTRRWLLTTVLKSLATEIACDESGDFAEKFSIMLKDQIGEKKKKIRLA